MLGVFIKKGVCEGTTAMVGGEIIVANSVGLAEGKGGTA
jgi:hypothetical protein